MGSLNLNSRHEIEKKFHDDWAEEIHVQQISVRDFFEVPTAVENRLAIQRLGDLRGKKILDLGCGAGEASVYFALKGAQVFSVDLSEALIEKTLDLAGINQVFIQASAMPAEQLKFPDNFFDYVYGFGILHHADLNATLKEVSRVLTKSGKAVFIEPLSYNPVINVYRRMARDVRTPTEQALSMKDLRGASDFFEGQTFDFCWLTALNIFLYIFFIERIHPSEDRYWKRIIREYKRYEKMFNFFHSIDQFLLRAFPFLKCLCWTVVMTLDVKKTNAER